MKNIYLLSALALLWGFAPVHAQNTDLGHFFTFEASDASGLIPPYTPFKVKVNLKGDFSGTVKLYSCDKAKFRLLDIGNGEYAENVTYEVNAKQGPIAKFDAEFYGTQGGTQPLICGEYSGTNQLKGTRYAARQANRQIFRPDISEDWYDTNILDALGLSDSFAQARTKKLLTNYYPPDKVKSILPGLVARIIKEDQGQRAESTLKMIIAQHGGKEAAEALKPALKDSEAKNRIKAIELLSICGSDASVAADDIKDLLLKETDTGVLRDALLLAKNKGFDIPEKYLNIDDISPDFAAVHKKEIKDICDFAASIDISESDLSQRYDDKGNRIPIPQNAQKAITDLESLITRMPDYPEAARAYFLLGNLKERFMSPYKEIFLQEDPWRLPPPEIEGIREQYENHESAGEYMYNGWHYKELMQRYPGNEYADDAAYKLAQLGPFGEVETSNGELNSILYPMAEFIEEYPNSPLVYNALAQITTGFTYVGNVDFRAERYMWYYPKQFRASVKKYEETVKNIPLPAKAIAYDTISEAWMKLGDFAKAKELCEFILKDIPEYSQISVIKERLAKLNKIDFTLNPVEATDSSAKLTWDSPNNNTVSSYSIYRSTTPADIGFKIGETTSALISEFSDTNVKNGETYWYTINAIGPNVSLHSNQTGVTARKPEGPSDGGR